MIRFVLAVGLAGCLLGAEEDWGRGRGPNGSGVSTSVGLPVEFGPAQNLVWRTEVPFARSSPIIVKNQIYLTATDGAKLVTLSLDRMSGRILWRRELARTHSQKVFKGNDSATPTPVSDGANVFAFFPDFGLISYGPDGNERWRMKLGPFESFYGVSASPVLHGDTLYQVCDQNSGSFVIAVDSKTGKPRWRKERPNAKIEAYSTPAIFVPGEGGSKAPQLIVSGSYRVDAYDLATGDLVWYSGGNGTYPVATPTITNGVVYVTSEGADTPGFPAFETVTGKSDANKDGKISQAELTSFDKEWTDHFGWFDLNKDGLIVREEWETQRMSMVGDHGLLAIRGGGSGDVTAKNLAWRYKKVPNLMASPLVYGGVMYTVKDGGIMTSLNPATGDVYKTGRLKDFMGPQFSSPVAGDGKIYVCNEAGKMNVIKAGAQWEPIAVTDLKEECYASPAIAGSHLYVRTRNALYSFGK